MNEIDRKWLKALKYCANNSRAMINSTEEQYPGEWVKYVPKRIETTFVKWAYFDMNGNSSHIITQKGLGELRDLEQINARDKTFWIATIALIISIIALIKSMGLF